MNDTLLFYIYLFIHLCFGISLIFFWMKKAAAVKTAGLAGTAALFLTVVLIFFWEKRPPLYGPFESAVFISAILSFLVMIPKQGLLSAAPLNHIAVSTYFVILVILGFQIFQPKIFNSDFYMYDSLKVIVFFNFRLIAASLFIYAAIIVNYGVFFMKPSANKELVMKSGRNYLLTAAAVYLISEWSGSIWCLDWLGDTWQWSKGFFRSSAIFLLVMISCHIPPAFSASKPLKAVLMTLPGVFIFWMIFHHI